jgi:hypothetical protein
MTSISKLIKSSLAFEVNKMFDNVNSNIYIYPNSKFENGAYYPKCIDLEKLQLETIKSFTLTETYFRDLVKIESTSKVTYAKKISKGKYVEGNLIVSNLFELIESDKFPNITTGHYKTTKNITIFKTKYTMLELLSINDVLTIKVLEKPLKSLQKKLLITELNQIILKFF